MCHTGLNQKHHPFSKGFLAPFYFSSQFKYCFFHFPHLHQSLPTLSLIFNVSLRISSLFPKAIFFFLLFVVQDHPRLSNVAVKCQSFKIIAPKVCISHKHRNLSWATWVITYETPIKCVHFIATCLLWPVCTDAWSGSKETKSTLKWLIIFDSFFKIPLIGNRLWHPAECRVRFSRNNMLQYINHQVQSLNRDVTKNSSSTC